MPKDVRKITLKKQTQQYITYLASNLCSNKNSTTKSFVDFGTVRNQIKSYKKYMNYAAIDENGH